MVSCPTPFFRDSKNSLILFEEMGDNPSQVNFQTIVVGSTCGRVYEGKTLELSCQKKGQTISTINFGSFGDPQGTCRSFVKGSCESTNSISTVEKACVGQESCSIEASEEILGTLSHCGSDLTKSLAVEIVC
ncbi:hypothetical protein IFM89_016904 [Coptis chinensis]|uniref:SUEL-type lectin domain-containing protein n=1 Tax=Coptis chinensis TaxID=261450 RepID=A0A835I3Y4_9MAGN|nr:hypothetical protein IFM89_016904 [Coptis chinensis]